MDPISQYNEFVSKLKVASGNSDKIVFLLIAEPYNDTIGQYIGRIYRYLHFKTGKDLIFYCPGYFSGVKIRYNQEGFTQFVKEFESITSWKYRGEISLLMIHYKGGELQFNAVYELNLTRMQRDGLINNYRDFIERLIGEFFNTDNLIDSEYKKLQMESVLNNFTCYLPIIVGRAFRRVSDNPQIHRHLKMQDIRKKA